MIGTQRARTPLLLCGVAALALTATGLTAAGLTALAASAADDVEVLSLGEGRHEIIIENGEITIDGESIDVAAGAHVTIDDDEIRIMGADHGFGHGFGRGFGRGCEQSIVINGGDDGESQRIVTHGCGDHGARMLRFHDSDGVSVFSHLGELHALEALEELEALESLEGLEDDIHLIIEQALSAHDVDGHIVIHRDTWRDNTGRDNTGRNISDEERREIEDAHREARDAAREAGREARNVARHARHAARDARALARTGRDGWNFDFDDITRDAARIGEAVEDWPDGEYELRRDGDVTIATGPDGVERRLEGFGDYFDDDDGTARITIQRDDD